MNKEMIVGLIRHALTFGGGIVGAKGLADDGLISEIIGALMTLVGAGWSVVSKKKTVTPAVSLIAPFVLAGLLVGCASVETTSYRALGTTAVLVDGAMNGWGDYVRSGQAKPEQEQRVRTAYESGVDECGAGAVVTAKTAPEGEAALDKALREVDAGAAAILGIVKLFIGPAP